RPVAENGEIAIDRKRVCSNAAEVGQRTKAPERNGGGSAVRRRGLEDGAVRENERARRSDGPAHDRHFLVIARRSVTNEEPLTGRTRDEVQQTRTTGIDDLPRHRRDDTEPCWIRVKD